MKGSNIKNKIWCTFRLEPVLFRKAWKNGYKIFILVFWRASNYDSIFVQSKWDQNIFSFLWYEIMLVSGWQQGKKLRFKTKSKLCNFRFRFKKFRGPYKTLLLRPCLYCGRDVLIRKLQKFICLEIQLVSFKVQLSKQYVIIALNIKLLCYSLWIL